MINSGVTERIAFCMPDGLPDNDAVQIGMAKSVSEVSPRHEPLRSLQSLATYVTELCSYNSEAQLYSLDEAVETGTGTCTHITAVTALIARSLPGFTFHPTIESIADAGSLHAFNTVRDTRRGALYRCDSISGAEEFSDTTASVLSYAKRLEAFASDHPELLTTEGIAQARIDREYTVRVHENRAARSDFDKEDVAVLTFFNGDSGLLSYLALIDRLRTKRLGLSKPMHYSGLLLPKL